MASRFFIEGVCYTAQQILTARIMSGSPHREPPTGDAIDKQVDDKSAAIPIINLLSSMKIGNKTLLKSVKDGYRFNYVGVIAADGFLFPILPKYYMYAPEDPIPSESAVASLADVLDAIRKYFTSHPTQQDELTFSPAAAQQSLTQNQLGLYRFLLEDYAQNGPYTRSRRIQEFNGEGEIDWPRTIGQITPVMSDGSPVYMEIITSRRTYESSNFIARMQLAMLAEISTLIEDTGLNTILNMPLVKNARETLEDIGDVTMLMRRLQQELNVQFETRKKLLLLNMLNYLRNYSPADKSSILAEGTGSYDRVWEDICQQIFHHDDQVTLPKPSWEFFPQLGWNPNSQSSSRAITDVSADEKTAAGENDEKEGYNPVTANPSTLIPDVINTEKLENKSSIYILDAKYYIPEYADHPATGKKSSGQITSQPGIGDLIKQYFYMMALRQELPLKEDKNIDGPITILGNAFVLPSQLTLNSADSPSERYLLVQRGQVSLKFMSDEDKNSPKYILLFELDAEQATSMYLDSIPDTTKALDYLHQMFTPEPSGDLSSSKAIKR